MIENRLQPLFRPDQGWLYVLAGLAIIAAATIVPSQRDLIELENQLQELKAKEDYGCRRMAAYSRFLDEWDQLSDELVVRLAGSQLNQRPTGDRAVVLTSHASTGVTDWIDTSVSYDAPEPQASPDSMLNRLTTGRGQLWMLAAGALTVFVGLVLGPASAAATAAHDRGEERDSEMCDAEEIVLTVTQTSEQESTAPGGRALSGVPVRSARTRLLDRIGPGDTVNEISLDDERCLVMPAARSANNADVELDDPMLFDDDPETEACETAAYGDAFEVRSSIDEVEDEEDLDDEVEDEDWDDEDEDDEDWDDDVEDDDEVDEDEEDDEDETEDEEEPDEVVEDDEILDEDDEDDEDVEEWDEEEDEDDDELFIDEDEEEVVEDEEEDVDRAG